MIGDWLPNLMLAWSVHIFGVMSPGPSVALILSVATSAGRPAALTTCLGIGAASAIFAIVTVLGLAAIFSEAAWAMTLVKAAGTAYLLWLAWGSFRKAAAPPAPPVASPAGVARRTALAGFMMQITNPKAIFFWVAIAALAGLDAAPAPIIVFFVVCAFIISFTGHGAWALALSSRPFLAVYGRVRRWIEGALGVFFTFAAFKLATARS